MTDSSDQERVRLLAHPLRTRILARLRQHGPATATDLAGALGTNSGATSYHLRRLASVGLVVESGRSAGRRRIWQAGAPLELAAAAGPQDDVGSALLWLEHDVLRHALEQTDQWWQISPRWPDEWRRATGTSDAMVLVTAAQVEAMRADVDAVVQRYRRIGQGNPAAKRVAVYLLTVPLDVDR